MGQDGGMGFGLVQVASGDGDIFCFVRGGYGVGFVRWWRWRAGYFELWSRAKFSGSLLLGVGKSLRGIDNELDVMASRIENRDV